MHNCDASQLDIRDILKANAVGYSWKSFSISVLLPDLE